MRSWPAAAPTSSSDVHRWFEHTSELELHIDSPTLCGVFEDALGAFAELVAEGANPEQPFSLTFSLEARDPATLLAEFLEELIFLAETQGFVPERPQISVEAVGTKLTAIVQGTIGEPPHLVKAVTYHGLELRREGDGFHARAVLDV